MTGLLGGFLSAFQANNLWPGVLGCLLGTVVGVIPGMAPTAAIGLLLPVSILLGPLPGLIFLAALYYGTQYGSSVSAILMNMPSEPPSVVLARDGYQLTRRGRGGAAIIVAAASSFIGGMLGLFGLAIIAPWVSNFALRFGPAEFLAISIFGLLIMSRFSSPSWGNALVAVGLGVAFSTVGLDPVNGVQRFTMGTITLQHGISVVPIAVGFFGVAEVIRRAYAASGGITKVQKIKLRELIPKRSEWMRSLPASLRGSVVGFVFGSLPGPALVLASYASYKVENILRRGRNEDSDLITGVAGPKAADDCAVGATLGPLMVLGLPFTPVTAVLFAGFVLKGLQPGPTLIKFHPGTFWGLIGAMLLANIVLLILNVPGVNIWVRILRIPGPYLAAVMLLMMIVGVFALNNSWSDVLIMAGSGVLGLLLDSVGLDRAVVILGLVLGPTLEESFRQALISSNGHLGVLVRSNVSLGIYVITLCAVAVPPLIRLTRNKRGQKGEI